MFKKHVLLAAAFLLPFIGLSQVRQARFNNMSVESGLPENSTNGVLKDHLGYLWICTQNGVIKYDGYNYETMVIRTPDGKRLAMNNVVSIIRDLNDTIWIGTRNYGVFRYNRGTNDFTQFTHTQESSNKVQKELTMVMQLDTDGNIWKFNTADSTIHVDKLNPKTGKQTSFIPFPESRTIPIQSIVDVLVSKKSGIWVATRSGLYLYNPKTGKFENFIKGPIFSKYTHVYSMYEDKSGLLWMTVAMDDKKGLVAYDRKNDHINYYKFGGSETDRKIFNVFEDKQRNIWIGTSNGLILLNPKTGSYKTYDGPADEPEPWANYCSNMEQDKNGAIWTIAGKGILYLQSPQSRLIRFKAESKDKGALPTNFFIGVIKDQDEDLWFGTQGFGVFSLDRKRSIFSLSANTPSTLSYRGGLVRGTVKLKNGDFLIGNEEGLFRADPTLSRFVKIDLKDEGGKSISPNKLAIDKDGMVWISGYPGVHEYNPNTGKVKSYIYNPTNPNSLSAPTVSDILIDAKNNIWIGTEGGGVCQIIRETKKIVRYPYIVSGMYLQPKNGELDDHVVLSIYEATDGTIWVGTNDGGLNKLDQKTGRFTSYKNHNNGFFCITSIFEDSRGRMWVGSYLWGLFIFDKNTGKIKRFLEKDGLAYDQSLDITEDRSGKIWVQSERGFSIVDPDNFSVRTLTKENGLPENRANSRSKILIDGNDWIVGTKTGLLRFNPDDYKLNTVPPKVSIHNLRYSNGEKDGTFTKFIDNDKELTISYKYDKLTINYVGINFENSALNQYQYKLEGYDKNWIKAGKQRTATYTNLAPGTYNFLVKAANSDGFWTDQPAKLEITISTPWWKTWWAYIIYLTIIGLIIQSYFAYRSNKLKQYNTELEAEVKARTVELSEANEELTASQEEVIAQRDELSNTLTNLKATQTQLIQAEKMASLGELTAGIAHEIQNPLNFVNNFSDVSMELFDEMKTEFENGDKDEAFLIADDIKSNLEKINQHGKRADSIVKSMLQHSRTGNPVKELTDINALADEYLRLAYHGLRAKDKSFNAELITDFESQLPPVSVIAQDIGRVFLNLYTNAFYATRQRANQNPDAFKPTVKVTTRKVVNNIEIIVKDNGTGIPDAIKDKILQPFFTTKPTGEGTGLGLSLSYDIVAKSHGGDIRIDSVPNEFTEFTISLPI